MDSTHAQPLPINHPSSSSSSSSSRPHLAGASVSSSFSTPPAASSLAEGKGKGKAHPPRPHPPTATASSSSSANFAATPMTPSTPVTPSTSFPAAGHHTHRRRTSYLSPGLSSASYTSVELGGGRLICCTKSSQGFDWNPELFLPRYLSGSLDDSGMTRGWAGDDGGGERDWESRGRGRDVQVEEVRVSEEEAGGMFPSDW